MIAGEEWEGVEDLFANAPGVALHGLADPGLDGLIDVFPGDEAGVEVCVALAIPGGFQVARFAFGVACVSFSRGVIILRSELRIGQ